MIEEHPPKIHAFGHYHCVYDDTIGDTRFICVDILNEVDISPEMEVNYVGRTV